MGLVHGLAEDVRRLADGPVQRTRTAQALGGLVSDTHAVPGGRGLDDNTEDQDGGGGRRRSTEVGVPFGS